MNYILGGSYKTVLFTLYLKNVLNEEVTIVTYSKVIQRFCEEEHINHIDFEKIRPSATSIYNFFILKKTLDEIIDRIDIKKDDKFYLTSNTKAYDSFYLAKELSKKGGTVYFKITDLEGRELNRYKSPWYKPIFIGGSIIRFFLKLILDLDIIYFDTHNVPCFGIDNVFFVKYNINEFEPNRTIEELISEALKKSKTTFKKHDNLIIGQGMLSKIIKFDSMVEIYKSLFDLPLDFVFKKHPESEKSIKSDYLPYYRLFENCIDAPEYYPVELFMNNIRKNVISISSTALITASKQSHLRAISLLELVDWKDASFKEEWKKNLMTASKNKILFPRNFDQLKEYLEN